MPSPQDDSNHRIVLSDLPPNSYKTYGSAEAHVYHKAFEASDREWTKTGHKGTVVFGRERSSGGDDMSSIGHGSPVDKEKYWFRLVDRGRTVWMIKVPSILNYQLDKPFFHVFPGRSRMFGFRFEDDEEAAAFSKKVLDRTSGRNVHPHKTPTKKTSKSMSISSQRGRISTNMISAPTPNSFVHVAHVGINEKGIIETSKDIDPTWTSLINELQGYGITQSICEEQLDFIEGFLAGAKSVDPKVSIPSPKKQETVPEIRRTIRRRPATKF